MIDTWGFASQLFRKRSRALRVHVRTWPSPFGHTQSQAFTARKGHGAMRLRRAEGSGRDARRCSPSLQDAARS